MASYCTLVADSKYMKRVTIGASSNLTPAEREACETYATAYIDGRLKAPFDEPPPLIVDIAEMLAASKAYSYLHKGAAPGRSEYATFLKEDADDLIKQLLAGHLALYDSDGELVSVTTGPLAYVNRALSRDTKDCESIAFQPTEEWEDMEDPEDVY